MPELPEVETVVRELRPQLVGRRIRAVHISRYPLRRRWCKDWEESLIGRRVADVRRRGKWIIFDLHGDSHLVFHLGMTGQLTVRSVREPIEPHTHLTLSLNRRRDELRFRDVRRFGSVSLVANSQLLQEFFEDMELGPEPFDLVTKRWHGRLRSTSRCLKAVLLDQKVVAGVGNIYADESLFKAKLHPARIARTVSMGEAGRLRKAIIHVLNHAITLRGSSIRDYVGGTGQRGEYQREFLVYGQAGEPCPRCRAAIACIRLAGRSTHFCRRCQRPGASRNGIRRKGS